MTRVFVTGGNGFMGSRIVRELVGRGYEVTALVGADLDNHNLDGIRCEVRNTALSGAIGEIPWAECAPQIWIDNRLDEPRAHQLIREASRAVDGPRWQCGQCGETLEPQFGACWQCGTARGG